MNKPVSRPTCMPRLETWLAVALLLLAAWFRFYRLADVPPGIFNDETVEIVMLDKVLNGRWAIFFPEDTGHEVAYTYALAPLAALAGQGVWSLRAIGVMFNLLGLAAIWALTRRLLGALPAAAALAGLAVSFWSVHTARMILHVTPVILPAALAAYGFWRSAHTERGATRLAIGGGISLGVAIHTYTAARALPLVFVIFLMYVGMFQRALWRACLKTTLVFFAAAAVTAAPLAGYLVAHPQADQFEFVDLDLPLRDLRAGDPRLAISTTLQTLGMFAWSGDQTPYLNTPGRPIFEPVGALLFGLGLLVALARLRRDPACAFMLLWTAVALMPGALSQPAPSFTHTIAAQVSVFAFPGLAASALGRALYARQPRLAIAAGLVILFANAVWTWRDYMLRWPALPDTRFWYQAGLKEIAALSRSSALPISVCAPPWLIDTSDPWWHPAREQIKPLLPSAGAALRWYDCQNAAVLPQGGRRAMYAFATTASADGLDATPAFRNWLAGSSSIGYGQNSAWVEADAQGRLANYVASIARPAAPVTLENKLEFVGYELPASVARTRPITLTTAWRALDALPAGLVMFTHVMTGDGSLVAQQDWLGADSASLQPGDIFAQTHVIPTLELRRGTYSIAIGMYLRDSGQRLQIDGGDAQSQDRIFLRPVTITRRAP